MSGVFISYRRSDSADDAHRLARLLRERLGRQAVFIDVEDIRPGDDFAAAIGQKVGFCDVLIALIGPTWLTSTGAGGGRRLDDPADWVRIEIASALERPMQVIPVLVGGASLPAADVLPDPLKPLAQRQAAALRPEQFDQDAVQLAGALVPIPGSRSPVALWLAIVARGHQALDPLSLDRPETLRRALLFLLYMAAINTVLRLPTMQPPEGAGALLGFGLALLAAKCAEWLGYGLALHVAMKSVGGQGTLQKSIAVFCFLAAYLPLIAMAQLPAWGLTLDVARGSAAGGWTLELAIARVQAFMANADAFVIVRLVVSFVVATFLWWRLYLSVLRAMRALHRLGTARSLLGLAIGIAAVVALDALVIVPYLDAVLPAPAP